MLVIGQAWCIDPFTLQPAKLEATSSFILLHTTHIPSIMHCTLDVNDLWVGVAAIILFHSHCSIIWIGPTFACFLKYPKTLLVVFLYRNATHVSKVLEFKFNILLGTDVETSLVDWGKNNPSININIIDIYIRISFTVMFCNVFLFLKAKLTHPFKLTTIRIKSKILRRNTF